MRFGAGPSSAGRGSRDGPDGAAVTGTPAVPVGSRTRILVADDDSDLLFALGARLEADGHRVQAAPDNRAAHARAGRALPHVAVLDLVVPGMDGFEPAPLPFPRRRRPAPVLPSAVPAPPPAARSDTEPGRAPGGQCGRPTRGGAARRRRSPCVSMSGIRYLANPTLASRTVTGGAPSAGSAANPGDVRRRCRR